MTILPTPQGIFFNHPIIGALTESQELGEMSMELILTLHTLSLLDENPDIQAEDSYVATNSAFRTNLINPSTGELMSKTDFTAQPRIRALRDRAYISATKGYNPPLIQQISSRHTPTLTPAGHIYAKNATHVINILNDEVDNLGYEPHRWQEADMLFNSASIPRRALGMLYMLNAGITEAEQRYASHNMSLLASRQDPVEDPSALAEQLGLLDPFNAPKNKANSDVKSLDETRVSLVSLMGAIDRVNMPVQEFEAALYPVGAQKFEAWVPTATFGQKARTDLKYLIKFGLVEIRAFISAGRGRSKHIIKPSLPGTSLLTDLARKKIPIA